MTTPKPLSHQLRMRDFWLERDRILNFSEPGTGKTAATLFAIEARNTGKRALVLAPKSILIPAWGNDCHTFTPNLSIVAAYAHNRRTAFELGTRVVVTNHDAAKWLVQNKELLEDFDTLVVDESTAYKNKDAARSKAVAQLAPQFPYRALLSGTPMPNKLLDVWHQAFLCDDGERLGTRYYAFRAATHEPVPVMIGVNDWKEKEGARDAVADLLADITIRYRLDECADIPEQHLTTRFVELPKQLRKHYDAMQKQALLALEDGTVTAVHAAAQVNKLAQIASGAVYGDAGYHLLDTERYDLIAQLCAERPHTLVAFQWRHQRAGLIAALEKSGIDTYGVIDGTTPSSARTQLIDGFQAGKYKVLLAQPQSAGHGLTLTRARTTIWASPTWNAEHFEQFNRRTYRTGQTERTEVILICARNTVDERIAEATHSKTANQGDLLTLLKSLNPLEAA